MQKQAINFRADPELQHALTLLAEREGVSVSNVIRTALDDLMIRTANSGTLLAAGRGDLASQRLVADEPYQVAVKAAEEGGDEITAALMFGAALAHVRLAATHGERKDAIALVFLLVRIADWLLACGQPHLAAVYRGQALYLSEARAEGGDQEFADMIVACADDLDPSVFRAAQMWRESVEA